MLVDGRIRSQILLIADAVHEDVPAALAETLREASTRRRRLVVTRIATAAVVVVATAGAWFVPDWSFTEQTERQQPADDMKHWDPDPAPEERSDIKDHDLLRDGGGALGPTRAPSGNGTPSDSADARRPGGRDPDRGGVAGDRAAGALRDDPLQESNRTRISHRDGARYQIPVARSRVEPRQSCSVFGEGCVRFATRPEDRFMRVTVRDDSGASVLVRITQWDSEGRTVVDSIVYCGGTSQELEIVPATEFVVVEIEDGDCRSETVGIRPSGGQVDFVSFHG